MKKRGLSLFLALVLCLTLLPATAWAAGADDSGDTGSGSVETTTGNWIDSAETDWYTKAEDGTTEFTISTAAQLAGLAQLVNSGTTFSGKTITLGADIDLSGKEWTPIGNSSKSFRGTFDGNGKTVSNLYIHMESSSGICAGLFGYMSTGGKVQNLSVSGEVTATNMSDYESAYVGGVVGQNSDGTVENCSFTGEVTATTTGKNGYTYAGGMVGWNYSGTVTSSDNTGAVTATINGGEAYAGGVVGQNYNNASVEGCQNTGTVNATVTGDHGYAYVGGVVGQNYSGTVTSSSNIGAVKAEVTSENGSAYVGGVVGRNYSGTVTSSGNIGAVTSENGYAYVGGVVGGNDDTVTSSYNAGTVTATTKDNSARVGGVLGYNVNGTVTSSYNTGSVSNTNGYTGGVVGGNYGTVSNCYFLKDGNDSLNAIGIGSGSVTNVTNKTATEFASGEVAWLLSGGENQAPTSPWRQNLSGEDADDAPVLDSTHAQVAKLGTAYANTSTGADGKTYYLIYTAEQLQAFASAVNGGSSTINAKLMDNIDLSSVCGATIGENGEAVSWTPIVNGETLTFQGTFDGQGNSIENLYINSTSSVYAGLFGYVGESGTVKNLNVKGTVTAETSAGNLYVGGVVGYAYGSATVKNCSNSGAVTAESKHVSSAGGVVGGVSGGNSSQVTVENCRNTGAVSNTSNAESGEVSVYTGGVVGYACYADVKNCYNTGAVKSACDSSDTFAANNTGGVVGCVVGGAVDISTVESCYNTGAVTVTGPAQNYTGGAVGWMSTTNTTTVSNCYFLQDTDTGLSGIGYVESSSSASASNTGAEGKTEDAFASGEVAYLLQNGQEGTVWVQALDTDENGTWYPALKALLSDSDTYYTVYQVTFQVEGDSSGAFPVNKYAVADGTVTLPTAPNMGDGNAFAGWYDSSNNEFTAETKVTVNMTVTAKARPDISIDYENETLTGFVSGATYTIDGETVTLGNDLTLPVTDYIGQTVSIVRKLDDSANSEATSLTIPARLAAPEVSTKNETITGLGDGQLTGTTAAMEYSTDGEPWTPCTADMTVTSGNYLVRYAATENSFASASTSVTVGANIVVTTPDGTTPTYDETGNVTLPGGSTVQVGETTITIGEDTSGAAVDENGKITLPGGGTVTVETEDGETVTITTPEGGEITVNEGDGTGETTLTVPGGSTVQTGTGPEITLPKGGDVAEDGSVTAGTVQVGDTTITAPEGKTVTTTPGGTTTAPGGTTVEIGETKITIGEDTTATVDQTGSVTLPEGGTVTVTTGEGQTETATITVPETGGTIGVDDEGNLLLPGGSTVAIGGTESTIPESGGALDPATGQITYNTYLVTFNSQGGSQVSAQTVTAGGTVKQPASPTRTGYTFAGWYKDAACQTPWNFTTDTVTGNLTLYAKWTVKSTTPTYTPTVEKTDNGTVSITPTNPKQGTTVTVTPKPDAGYEVDTIAVTDKNGNPVQVTDKGDGTYSFTQPASKVTVAVTFTETKQPAPDLPFTDVDPAAWYAEAVSYMLERGLMTGTAPDTFSPNSTTTRAMIVTILYRLEGEPSASNDGTFTDVEKGTWYTDPIAWAAANGVVEGITPTTFAPNAPVTREQMATILYRYLAAKGYDVTARADLSAYTDANQVSSYATEAMSWANALGLITGDTPATLTPQASATRAQVATILMRFCGSIER